MASITVNFVVAVFACLVRLRGLVYGNWLCIWFGRIGCRSGLVWFSILETRPGPALESGTR